MHRNAVDAMGWAPPFVDEEDDTSMGPEDYAWFAQTHPHVSPDWVPNLQWIWDRSDRERVDELIALAALQPMGSA
jgi:hypothetical protein